MSKKIYKYKLDIMDDVQVIEMPKNSDILSVQTQNPFKQIISFWAMVDTDQELESRSFKVYGTGQEIEEGKNLKHLGTIQMYDDSLVLHCFEIINP